MTQTPREFSRFQSARGQLARCDGTDHGTTVHGWTPDSRMEFGEDAAGAFFGFVVAGPTRLQSRAPGRIELTAGQFFCLAAPFELDGGSGIVIRHTPFEPIPVVGGPIESRGRLRYISGCTDTVLIAPLRCGDPCLNALYFPPSTVQQPHTHPSVRVGIIAEGRGEAVLAERNAPLESGDIFVIPAGVLHSFRTAADSRMIVVAYHPDSDSGPRDDDHPMINRTMIDGVSAAHAASAIRSSAK